MRIAPGQQNRAPDGLKRKAVRGSGGLGGQKVFTGTENRFGVAISVAIFPNESRTDAESVRA